MVLLAVEAIVLVVLHVGSFVALSPVDELQHFDHLVRSSRPSLLLDPDEPFAQETLREVSCREAHDDAWVLAPTGAACLDQGYVPEDFWWRGLNSSYSHGPVYYATTGVAARGLRAVVPGFGLLTWARLLGAAWAIAGCYLVLRTARLLLIRPWAVAILLAGVVASPGPLEAFTMVNPDAAMLAAGGAVLLAAVAVDQGRWPLWSLGAAAALAMLTDSSAAVVIIAVAVYFALRAFLRRSPRVAVAAGVAVACAALTVLAWTFAQRPGDFEGSPQQRAFEVDALETEDVVGRATVLAMMPPLSSGQEPVPLRAEPVPVFNAGFALLLAGGLVAVVLRARLRDRQSVLAVSTTVALLVTGPLLVAWNYAASSWYYSIPARYGISAIPAMVVAVAPSLSRVGRIVAGALVAGGVVATSAAMLGA